MIRIVIITLLSLVCSCGVAQGPSVVAATSWAAAFAEAAGARDVTVIAPAGVLHPPDYDPKPSDLLAIDRADFVLVGGFEGFLDRLHRAVGNASATLVEIELVNDPDVIRREVLRLADMFQTTQEAEAWLDDFEAELSSLQAELLASIGDRSPIVIAHQFMAPWADFGQLDLAATYGPAPVTPTELAELVALQPDLILANRHTGGSDPLMRSADARVAMLINFPGQDEGLLDVFRHNVREIGVAMRQEP